MDKVAISRRQLGGEAPMAVSKITPLTVYSGLFGSLDVSSYVKYYRSDY